MTAYDNGMWRNRKMNFFVPPLFRTKKTVSVFTIFAGMRRRDRCGDSENSLSSFVADCNLWKRRRVAPWQKLL